MWPVTPAAIAGVLGYGLINTNLHHLFTFIDESIVIGAGLCVLTFALVRFRRLPIRTDGNAILPLG